MARCREVPLVLIIEAPQSFLHCQKTLEVFVDHGTKGVRVSIWVKIDFGSGRKERGMVVDLLPKLHAQVAVRLHQISCTIGSRQLQ